MAAVLAPSRRLAAMARNPDDGGRPHAWRALARAAIQSTAPFVRASGMERATTLLAPLRRASGDRSAWLSFVCVAAHGRRTPRSGASFRVATRFRQRAGRALARAPCRAGSFLAIEPASPRRRATVLGGVPSFASVRKTRGTPCPMPQMRSKGEASATGRGAVESSIARRSSCARYLARLAPPERREGCPARRSLLRPRTSVWRRTASLCARAPSALWRFRHEDLREPRLVAEEAGLLRHHPLLGAHVASPVHRERRDVPVGERPVARTARGPPLR